MKNKLLIFIIVILILIVGAVGYFSLFKKTKIPPKGEIPETGKEVFTLTATVLRVDSESNSLIVKPFEEEKEIKVILTKDTELLKLELTSDPKKPPLKTKIKISDLSEGKRIFIGSIKDMAGKMEIDDVLFILLPVQPE
jgi:flagellar basal body-associated protein FliL